MGLHNSSLLLLKQVDATRVQFLTVATTEANSYAGQPMLRDPDVPVKLILFENFMCEYCHAFEAEGFPQLKRDYIDTGRVKAYLREPRLGFGAG